jgi:hypothetical protein
MGLRTFGVPKKHAEPIELGHQLIETTALREAAAWWAARPPLLVLAGPVGTGKSLAAAWLVQQRWQACERSRPGDPMRDGGVPIWLGAPLVSRVQTWGDGAAKIASWRETMLLVLDDLGVEDASDRTNATLDDLINHRFENALPTVVTTNLSPKQFEARYGARIRDRVRGSGLDETGKARWWIVCGGDSLRGRVEPTPVPPEEVAEEQGPFVSIETMKAEVERLRVEFARREEEQELARRREIEELKASMRKQWGAAE